MTTLPDGRILMCCRDCGDVFPALGEWQSRCRRCYATLKAGKAPTQEQEDIAELHRALRAAEAENARLRWQLADLATDRDRWRTKAMSKPKAARKTKTRIPKECWRRLVQLAHPDRHGGSEAANAATRWLLENRP